MYLEMGSSNFNQVCSDMHYCVCRLHEFIRKDACVQTGYSMLQRTVTCSKIQSSQALQRLYFISLRGSTAFGCART